MKKLLTEKWLIPLAFFAIYFLWGAIYLANYLAIQDIPPFMMSATRFLVAGAIMFVIAIPLNLPKPSWKQWKNATISGFFFLVTGTGTLIWTLQFVDTGIASLIVALEPLVIVLLMWNMRGQRPKLKSWLGIFLGVSGMAVLVWQEQFLTDSNTLWGIGIILFSITMWGYATLFVTDKDFPDSKWLTSAMQMVTGGAILVIVSLLWGEMEGFKIQAVSAKAWGGWVFSVIGGSIIAFSAFNYLLSKVSPEKVATSTYVNPIVAMLLGWGFNNEVLTVQSFIAAILMLLGVFFIISRKGE